MKELARKVGIALLAACAGAIGNAIGQVACDTIKETFARPAPPAPEPEPTTKRTRRRR